MYQEGQKLSSVPLRLESQVVVSYPEWIDLGTSPEVVGPGDWTELIRPGGTCLFSHLTSPLTLISHTSLRPPSLPPSLRPSLVFLSSSCVSPSPLPCV